LERLIDEGILNFWQYQDLDMGQLYRYNPWVTYRAVESVHKAYESVMSMPTCWHALIEKLEDLQKPQDRDRIYASLAQQYNRPKSLYTNRRQPGIVGFLLPIRYVRCNNGYPRLNPLGPSNSKYGLLGGIGGIYSIGPRHSGETLDDNK
jgi:hypothetical protein